jgi:hypothetical protein
VLADPDIWDKVVAKMKTGQMPPVGMPRPDKEEVAALTRWIEDEFQEAERKAPANPGRVTARRLNRAEYNNTVRDLLGVDLRPADDFPQDDAGYGFDNNGDVLSVSPVLMEKYLGAAEKIARTALFGPGEMKPTLTKLQPPGGKIEPNTNIPAEYDVTGLTLPSALHAVHRFPVDGEYQVRVVMGGLRPAGSEPVDISFAVDGVPQVLSLDPAIGASFYDDKQDFTGKNVEFKVKVTAGEHWLSAAIPRYFEGLPARYGGPNPSARVAAKPEWKPRPNLTPEQLEESKKRFEKRMEEAEKTPVNEGRVRHLEVVGPFASAMGPSKASLTAVFACSHRAGQRHTNACLRPSIARLARRAFRRPVAETEVATFLALAQGARRKGDSVEQSMSLALEAILVSPDFLFRIERDPGALAATGAPVSDFELASRLSYFLWSSMPDDALLQAAEQKTLRDPAVLTAQVARMLKDPKSQALVDGFGGQWLQFRALESVTPDKERFPTFDNNLRLSMRKETELFVEAMVREDRSLLDLIDGPYSFLNERLARHYGIPGVTGSEFRRVDLTGTRRSGVLTQGSVLTVSSYATRTSPVLRGKWVLENILAAPPPDPPAGTPRLDEAKIGADQSLRKQLEAHRSNATCAACHSRMDPLGFGLENFDAIGAWRTDDGKYPIDAKGALPDGRAFEGPDEIKAILRGDRDEFAACVTEKLLTYALGRGLERYDRRTVKEIVGRLGARDYRFSALVLEIVNSMPFQMRRGERKAS